MNRAIFFLLLLALANAFAQQRVAIVNTEDDGEPQLKVTELNYLTARLREIAAKTLPKNEYSIMTEQSIMSRLGSKAEMEKKCHESEGCLAKLGIDIEADYVGQGRIGRFGKNLTIKVELYGSASGDLISSFTGESKDIHGLLKELDKKAPTLFKELLPDAEVYIVHNQPAATQYTPAVFTDSRDGKKYKMVKIGTQTWMAENLNYNASGSKCYGNKPANCAKYGRLYDWNIAMKSCPKGWHLPSMEEWDKLIKFVGGIGVAGTKLKAKSGWSTNVGYIPGTDYYGFSALPGGMGLSGDYFYDVGNSGNWSSSSEYDSYEVYIYCMLFNNEGTYYLFKSKDMPLGVRCVED